MLCEAQHLGTMPHGYVDLKMPTAEKAAERLTQRLMMASTDALGFISFSPTLYYFQGTFVRLG
jgi:hypothetical protein